MSNFIYYEHMEDYEEQVRKAKLCDEKDKEIERLSNELNQQFIKCDKYMTRNEKAIEYIERDLFNLNIQENIVAKYELLQIKDILKGVDKE